MRKLLIPYFIWNFVYLIIISIIRHFGITQYGSDINLQSMFITPWITGNQSGISTASWFVLALFLVSVAYATIRKIMSYLNITNHYFITAILMLVSIMGIELAMDGQNQGLFIPITRTMMYLFFYQFGVLYKEKIELYDKINSLTYFGCIIIVQFLLIYSFKNLEFVNLTMTFSTTMVFIPIATSLTGILFWLRVAKLASPLIEKSKLAIYAGLNTWTIMMHHQFFFFLLNLILMLFSVHTKYISGFDRQLFKYDIWYVYIPNSTYQFAFFYVILGIALPLITKYFVENIIAKKFKKNISNVLSCL